MGAANPEGAAHQIFRIAKDLGLPLPRIAIVAGDDLSETMSEAEILAAPTMEGTGFHGRALISANVYLGAEPVAEALGTGADIVLVGRTTDSALALGPLVHEYGWGPDESDRLAAGTMAGHLLECGGQVTGAYFADPGFKDVPGLARVGFPIAEIAGDGTMVITKPEGTGGMVTRATVTEQILYEMHDTAAYLVPDVTVDVTGLELSDDGPDRIRVTGVRGHDRPEKLKATVCVDNGWLGEAEMSYAGPNALARAELAGEVVRERLAAQGMNEPVRIDIIGAGSVLDGGVAERRRDRSLPFDGDYRVRVSALSDREEIARRVTDELQMLYCSGPAGGGGFRCHVTPQLATASILVDRRKVEPNVRVEVITP